MMPQDAGHPEPTSNPPTPRPAPRPVAGRVPIAAARLAAAMPDAPPALSSAPDFGALLKALRRRWMAAAVLSLLLGAAAAGAAWYLMTPKYTGFGILKVSANPGTVVFDSHDPASMAAQSTELRTAAAAFKSRRVILHALQQDEVKRLGLESRYPDPVDWIETETKAEFTDPGEFINVTLNANDPTEATVVMKNLIDAYMNEVVYAEQSAKAARLAEVEKIYADTANTLKRKRDNLKEDADKAGVALGVSDRDGLTRQQQGLLDNLRDAKVSRGQLSLELLKAQAELKALDIVQSTVKELTIGDSQVEAALQADATSRPFLERMIALKDLVQNIQSKTNDPRDPILVDAQTKLADLQGKLDKRRGELKDDLKARMTESNAQTSQVNRAQLENSVATLNESQTKLDADIKEMEARADKIGAWNNDLEAQRTEIKRYEGLADAIGTERDKLNVELKAPPRVSIWQNADLQKRDLKKQVLAAAAAPVGVALLVCMGVAWLDVRQRRVRSAGDVAGGLGIRVVGAVPGAPHLERRLTGAEEELAGSPALESIDAIRTQLLRDDGAEVARVVLVTSAGAGEGKTTLAGHLASSLARAGRKTLLIDGDLRRPSVHQLFELPMQPGFSEVLLGEVEAADAVQNTTQDGLAVLPAGQWDREVLQALARDGLEGLFERLREEFDFVVIDSHPVLAAADSLLIGQQADAVILSVMRDVSQTPRVYAASQKLAALGIRVLGAVVNGADPDEVFAAAPAAVRQKAAG